MMTEKLKTMGFVISHKENEKRLVLLPENLSAIKQRDQLTFEKGYGEKYNIKDQDYLAQGCHIGSRQEVLEKDIISEPKIGDAGFLNQLAPKQILFGWLHAPKDSSRMRLLQKQGVTAYEWADIYHNERHLFWENNQLAGMAAVYHAFQVYGRVVSRTKVAVLGRGNSAQGAIRLLNQLGAEVTIYNRQQEGLFQKELSQYEVVVNAVLWDKQRTDHIITRQDLKRMKKNSLLIDISCDRAGAIETSRPTTVEKPFYYEEGVAHYVVDHTPSIFFRTASEGISRVVSPYIDQLISGDLSESLNDALIIKEGVIQ